LWNVEGWPCSILMRGTMHSRTRSGLSVLRDHTCWMTDHRPSSSSEKH
jgi:hypothetical protein